MELTAEMRKSIEELVTETIENLSTESNNKNEETVSKSDTEISQEEVKKTEEIVANSTTTLEDPTSQTTEVEKSVDKDTDRDSNGGKDKIKSGTPQTEKQSMMKSEDKEEEKEDEKKEEKKDMKKMKKSLDELSEILMEDELEVITAWREANAPSEETVNKSMLVESNNTEIMNKLEEMNKSLTSKDELIKSLSEKVEKLSSQPAYDKRSIDNLETVEKSTESNSSNDLSKSQVLNAMLDLQKSGKGITSLNVAEYEATEQFTNNHIKEMVLNQLKTK